MHMHTLLSCSKSSHSSSYFIYRLIDCYLVIVVYSFLYEFSCLSFGIQANASEVEVNARRKWRFH